MKKIILALLFFISILGKSVNAQTFYSGDTTSNSIYLTFDDGFSLKNTTMIFETCESEMVPVTFFFHGSFLESCPVLVKKISQSKYCSISSHTYSHKDITKMSNEELKSDLKRYEDLYSSITGKALNKFFRPPMGFVNKDNIEVLNELGYTIVKWNVSYYDYNFQDDQGYNYALTNLKKQTQPGSIILMHTMTNSNVRVLKPFIDYCRNKGYIFKPLSELK